MTNIYVGNLLYATTEPELVEFFSQWGQVERATLVYDRETGRPRGFAFVEMPDAAEAAEAVANAHGKELNGRPLTVNEARPRGSGHSPRPPQDAQKPAGYGNQTTPGAITNPAPPAGDLPREDPLDSVTPKLPEEPLRRSGGYTNHLHR